MYKCNADVIKDGRIWHESRLIIIGFHQISLFACNLRVIKPFCARLNYYDDQETRCSTKGSINFSVSRLRERDEFVLFFQSAQSRNKRRFGPGRIHKNLGVSHQRY